MRDHSAFALVVATLLCACPTVAREPTIGGPCEDCESIFEGLPAQVESRSRIAPPGEPGEALLIEGVVRSADGKPAVGIIVYAYHTNATGIYPRGSTRHGRLRGWVRTDDNGRYRFDTIRPGAYPGRKDPQHVHMHVIEPGKAAYYIDDIHFDDDPLLTPEKMRYFGDDRGGDGVGHPTKDEQGTWTVRRDIVLGANIPGYKDVEK